MPLPSCSVCLEDCDPRGGKPLAIPACCGKQYHQDCLDTHIAAGHTTCPDCRAPFNMRAPAQLPPRPPPNTRRRQSTNPFLYLSSVFNPSSWRGNEGSSEGIGNTAGDGQDITQQGEGYPIFPRRPSPCFLSNSFSSSLSLTSSLITPHPLLSLPLTNYLFSRV